MESEYETVVEAWSLLTSGVPLLIHVFFAALQIASASFLGIQGLLLLLAGPGELGAGAGRLGFVSVPPERRHAAGLVALSVGLGLLAPLATEAPVSITLLALASGGGVAFFLSRLPGQGGRRRFAVAVACGFVAVFALYEGRDPTRQLLDVATKALDWRQHELAWQLDHDSRSPKVGDLAPDFELSDTTGANPVRLATFRGERPVALVFGSYT